MRKKTTQNQNALTLAQFCDELSISLTTGKNWIKQGKIIPDIETGPNPIFSPEYIKKFKTDIEIGKNPNLKSRRNKKFISGNKLYCDYLSQDNKNIENIKNLLEYLDTNNIELSENIISLIIAECSLQCFVQKFSENKRTNLLEQFLSNKISHSKYNKLIDDLIEDKIFAFNFVKNNQKIFTTPFYYQKDEDLLGFLYISCKNLNSRKANGIYYTPTITVKNLISKIFEINKNYKNKNIFDPCCGTGNFLLQLPQNIDIKNIYGNDIDELSIKITRLNMLLKFEIENIEILYSNFTKSDYFQWNSDEKFDYIIGNPPWGASFTDKKKLELKEKYLSAKNKNIESYDVILEQALKNVKNNGIISFVLPEVILNVKTHQIIREIIFEKTSIQYIKYLGNIFNDVHCPSIIIQLVKTKNNFSTKNTIVENTKKIYTIKTERKINPKSFCFNMTDEEYKVVKKIKTLKNAVYLKNNAIFALGIVTGNNSKFISNKKSKKNEIILKGSDIKKYKILPSYNYIDFEPKNFQQIAPTKIYRAKEKLLYKFVSNKLIFAYDNNKTLSLNSCNILIPRIENLDIKYILAILNSRIIDFYYQKNYPSLKVLKSALEELPIPNISLKEQQPIIKLVDKILTVNDSKQIEKYKKELDTIIEKLYI